MHNKIIILDGSNLQLLNQKLELISKKEFVGHNEPSKPVSLNSMSIYILRNVDINTKSFQRETFPILQALHSEKNYQTLFMITTNSKCVVEPHLMQDAISFLTFHPHGQPQKVLNKANVHQAHPLLPESTSFLGFYLRRKVIGLETSDIQRYWYFL